MTSALSREACLDVSAKIITQVINAKSIHALLIHATMAEYSFNCSCSDGFSGVTCDNGHFSDHFKFGPSDQMNCINGGGKSKLEVLVLALVRKNYSG